MELGEVSRTLALKGVEVAASIPSHGSITFEFQAGAAGHYRLEVRHLGEGLTLQATGPDGSANVDPGPAGPFSTIALDLKAADYRIKASAAGDQPVFVDWELLLTSGVGQSAAIGSSLASSSSPVPLPGLSGPTTSSAPPPPSISPANGGPTAWTSLVAARGPVGRSDPAGAIKPVGPTSSRGELALAHAGEGLPAGAWKEPGPVAEEAVPTSLGANSLLAAGLLGDARKDLDALTTPTWIDRLADFQAWATTGPLAMPTRAASPGEPVEREVAGSLAVVGGDPLVEESQGSTDVAGSPGMIAMGVILASAARRWRVGRRSLPRRRNEPNQPFAFPMSRA